MIEKLKTCVCLVVFFTTKNAECSIDGTIYWFNQNKCPQKNEQKIHGAYGNHICINLYPVWSQCQYHFMSALIPICGGFPSHGGWLAKPNPTKSTIIWSWYFQILYVCMPIKCVYMCMWRYPISFYQHSINNHSVGCPSITFPFFMLSPCLVGYCNEKKTSQTLVS